MRRIHFLEKRQNSLSKYLRYNSDLTRLKKITEKDIAGVEKHQKCLNYLLEVEKQSS